MGELINPERVTTVRMPGDLADSLDMVARIDGVSTSQAIRDAVIAHIEVRRADSEFQTRLRMQIAADQRIMERLR